MTSISKPNIQNTIYQTKVLTVDNTDSKIEYVIIVYNELVEKDTKLDMNGLER